MDHSPEELEYFSSKQNKKPEEKKEYHERPRSQRIMSWILIAIVLFAFFGTCYWLINFGRM